MAKIIGPECPNCECPDTEVIEDRLVFGQRRERCACAFCGHRFTADGLVQQVETEGAAPAEAIEPATESGRAAAVSYNPAPPRCTCPACHKRNPPVKSTTKDGARIIRYHKCECGHKFKSIEGE